MNIKKVTFLFVAFLLLFSIRCFAVEEADIDMKNIVTEFNNNEFVSKLSTPNQKIYAVERPNRYTLRKGNTIELTYVYNEEDQFLHTEIEVTSPNKDDLLLLNSLLIDTIAKMQGDTSGKILCAALSEAYTFTDAEFDGAEQYYQDKEDGSKIIVCNICPFVKITLPELNNGIPEIGFSKKYDTIYDDANTFIYYNDLVVLKTIDDNGKMVVYIGESEKNTNRSKESVKNLLKLLTTEKAINYFDQKITDLNNNLSVDGIELEANLTSLPFTEARVSTLPNNMKYAKFTIDLDTIKQKAEEIPEAPQASVGDPVSLSTKSFPLVTAIVILGIVFLVILIGIIKRHADRD